MLSAGGVGVLGGGVGVASVLVRAFMLVPCQVNPVWLLLPQLNLGDV